jgi:hypothetical protein
MPVIFPVVAPALAIVVEPLNQLPPGVASVSVTMLPLQILEGPEIAAGTGLTVTTVVIELQLLV